MPRWTVCRPLRRRTVDTYLRVARARRGHAPGGWGASSPGRGRARPQSPGRRRILTRAGTRDRTRSARRRPWRHESSWRDVPCVVVCDLYPRRCAARGPDSGRGRQRTRPVGVRVLRGAGRASQPARQLAFGFVRTAAACRGATTQIVSVSKGPSTPRCKRGPWPACPYSPCAARCASRHSTSTASRLRSVRSSPATLASTRAATAQLRCRARGLISRSCPRSDKPAGRDGREPALRGCQRMSCVPIRRQMMCGSPSRTESP